MKWNLRRRLARVVMIGGLTCFAASAAFAQCVDKAGLGQGTHDNSARFQAWEAVLQATDWSAWVSWMASEQKIGAAPGYAVKGLQVECKSGGSLGRECITRATLCKQ